MDIAAMPSSTSCTFIYSKILDYGNFNLQNFVSFLVNTYILGVNGWTGIVVVESNTNLMTNTDTANLDCWTSIPNTDID